MSKTLIPKSNKAREGEESSTRERDEKRERNLLPSFSQKRERRERERRSARARLEIYPKKEKPKKKYDFLSIECRRRRSIKTHLVVVVRRRRRDDANGCGGSGSRNHILYLLSRVCLRVRNMKTDTERRILHFSPR